MLAAVLLTACLSAGCATLGRVGEASLNAMPLAAGRPTLYVVPPESLGSLPAGTPLIVRVSQQPWVRGTALPAPGATQAVRLLEQPAKAGLPPDTVTVERSSILVALSPEPPRGLPERYTGKWPPPEPVTSTQVAVGTFMILVAVLFTALLGAWIFVGTS